MSESEKRDKAFTAITEDGAFRVIVLRTSATVGATLIAQKAEGANAEHLANVLTGSILVRMTMAPSQRVQGIIKGAGQQGTLVGDSHPDGMSRGLIQRAKGVDQISLGKGALMQMMRTLPRGEVSRGVVEIPDGTIGGGLMSYFQASEQIEAVARIGVTLENGEIKAGGYIVQLLPEVSRDPLAAMVARLEEKFSDPKVIVPTLHEDPELLLGQILEGMPFGITQNAEVHFGCQCSSVRVLSSLSTLPKEDIRHLMTSDEQLSITCDYCGQLYELPPKALEGLLSNS